MFNSDTPSVLNTIQYLHVEKFFAILVYADPTKEDALGVRTPDFETLSELREFVDGAMSSPTPYSSALLKKFTDLELIST
jgi:hypothetical protein